MITIDAGPMPKRPVKPKLGASHSVEDAKLHVTLLEKWEADMETYEEEMVEYRKRKEEAIKNIEAYIKKEAELDLVPEQYREKLYKYAVEFGYGGDDTLNLLKELVNIFV